MLFSLYLMSATKTPDLIIDKARDIIAVKNNNEVIVYSPYKLSAFTKAYFENWYGLKVSHIRKNIWREDGIYELNNGKTLSLNYSQCRQADFMLVTSNYHLCYPYQDNIHFINFETLKNMELLPIFFK